MVVAWPERTERRSGEGPGEVPEPVGGEGALAGQRWFHVWNVDPLGECCCWRGSVRPGNGSGARGACNRPGKHPWVVRSGGQLTGFVHGAADSVSRAELVARWGPGGGGSRQEAVVLEDLLVVDLDGARALRDFGRLAHTVPGRRVLGVSSSPRGFHVWLDVPGWNQRALNLWMAQWLADCGGWHGTDPGKAGRRGFLLDVRTGVNRFVIWPGGDAGGRRRWIGNREFGARLRAAAGELPGWRRVPGELAERAPWAVDTGDPWLASWIAARAGGAELDLSGLEPDLGAGDGGAGVMDACWAELERWLARLGGMPAGSGRNNLLNAVAYHSGPRCVASGWPVETVRARLVAAGESAGTHGVRNTVESGLGAGLRQLKAQRAPGVN